MHRGRPSISILLCTAKLAQRFRSTLHAHHSTLPHSAFHSPQPTLHTLQTLHFSSFPLSTFSLFRFHFPLITPRSRLNTPHFTLHTSHSTLHTPRFTLHTPHSTLHTSHFTPSTPRSKLHTPHSTLHTLHSTLPNPHSTLHIPWPTVPQHFTSERHEVPCLPHEIMSHL